MKSLHHYFGVELFITFIFNVNVGIASTKLMIGGKPYPLITKTNYKNELMLSDVSSTINQHQLIQNEPVNATTLFTTNQVFLHFFGSLTTPLCSENINWLVMKDPVEVSSKQVNQFARLIGQKKRSLQSLNWLTLLGTR